MARLVRDLGSVALLAALYLNHITRVQGAGAGVTPVAPVGGQETKKGWLTPP